MESRYIFNLAEAYKKGYELRYPSKEDASDIKLHYFKVKDDLPRIQPILGFIHNIMAAGKCKSLLDVGSGRGVFLFPLLRDFPELEVQSIDILPHRVEFLHCLTIGGVSNLKASLIDICQADYDDDSFDIVTLLEVLEHIPDARKALLNAVRIAHNYVVVSVPSKPDDNPEHIHLFSIDDMQTLLEESGCRKVKTIGVNGHNIFIASK